MGERYGHGVESYMSFWYGPVSTVILVYEGYHGRAVETKERLTYDSKEADK
jgi:hypothetical protein